MAAAMLPLQPMLKAAVLAAQKLPDNLSTIGLQIEGASPVTKCSYENAGGGLTQLGRDLPSSFLSTDTAGGFQGATSGRFARIAPSASTNSPAPNTNQ